MNKYKYLIFVALIFLILTALKIFPATSAVMEAFELKSYDFRQSLTASKQQTDNNVIVLAIDDDSLDILQDKYGQWPWNRNIYAEIINFLEDSNVKAVVFDLMFLPNPFNSEHDTFLSNTISKYDNVFVAMNFDNKDNEVLLPKKIKADLKNESKIDFLSYPGCRPILPQILNSTPNVGIINVQRDADGILRKAPLFIKYQNDVYPSLALKVFSYLESEEQFSIDESRKLSVGDKTIQLDKNGEVNLSWYGLRDKGFNSFKHVPVWRVLKSIDEKKTNSKGFISENNFEDKIVFVGVTATSMYDIKSTPISKNTPGIEFQATTFLNLMENNFIHKASFMTNLLSSFILVMLIGTAILFFDSAFVSIITSFLLLSSYFAAAVALYTYQHLWIDMVFPFLAAIFVMIFMYVSKYVAKARDFDYTYKLATTDGLTGLYNHRYMQEQIAKNIASSRRYKSKFSILLLDIDFFKKFNDTYGHQAGDAVLRYVADLLKKSIRSTDIAARYGGEELVVILTNTDNSEAYITADKICKKIASKLMKISDKQEVNVTVSIGVSTYPENGSDSTELIEHADKGLYFAKHNGRNQVGKVEEGQQSVHKD